MHKVLPKKISNFPLNSPLTQRGDHLGVAAVAAGEPVVLGEAAAAATEEAGEVGGIHSCCWSCWALQNK